MSVWQLASGFPLKSLQRAADVLVRVLRNHLTLQMSKKTRTTCRFLSPVTGQLPQKVVVVSGSGIAVARWSRSTKLTYVAPGYYWDGRPCPDAIPRAGHLSWYVTSHTDQLSLAIPSWVGTMGISQKAVMPCSWGVKAGMVRVWVAGKTVQSHCYTRAISERFRDNGLIIKCYISSSI